MWPPPLVPFLPLDQLRACIEDFATRVKGRVAPLAAPALALGRGRIAEASGDLAEATELYAAARAGYEEAFDAHMAAHAAVAEGACRVRAGDPRGADLLRESWAAFGQLEAPWEANRVRAVMGDLGLRVPSRAGRRSYGSALSPREQEVAALAAEGRTDQEIAAGTGAAAARQDG